VRIWAAISFSLTVGAWGYAQTVLKVRPLLDDEAMAFPAVFRVDIERKGSDTRGELVVELPNGWREVYPTDLATNARKRLYLTAPSAIYEWRTGDGWLTWRGADGERVSTELPMPLQSRLPIVFVGNPISGWERLSEMRVPFASALSKQHEAFSPPLHAYYLRPAALPDDWRGLLGLPVMVLVDGAEALSEAQWRAVRHWLAAGGTLVVSAGSFGAAVNLLPLADLIPRLTLPDAPVRLAPNPLAPPPQHPVRLMRPETLRGYRVLVGDTRAPLLLHRRVGAGNLYLFLGDLDAPEWRAWDGASKMMRTIVQGSVFPAERWQRRFDSAARLPSPLRWERLWVGVALLGGYFVAVWVLVAWLRRWRRLASVAAPLAGLTLLTSIGVIASAPRVRRHEPVAHRTLYLATDRLAVEAALLDGVVGAGVHAIHLPEGALVLPVGMGTPLEVWHASDAPEVRLRAGSWTETKLLLLRPTREFLQVEARREGNAVHLHNRSPRDLHALQLQRRADKESEPAVLWTQPMLRAGQSMRVPMMQALLADPNLCLTAEWQRDAPSDIFWNGTPVQEVNRLFVWVR
jgi:hypothetical protein